MESSNVIPFQPVRGNPETMTADQIHTELCAIIDRDGNGRGFSDDQARARILFDARERRFGY